MWRWAPKTKPHLVPSEPPPHPSIFSNLAGLAVFRGRDLDSRECHSPWMCLSGGPNLLLSLWLNLSSLGCLNNHRHAQWGHVDSHGGIKLASRPPKKLGWVVQGRMLHACKVSKHLSGEESSSTSQATVAAKELPSLPKRRPDGVCVEGVGSRGFWVKPRPKALFSGLSAVEMGESEWEEETKKKKWMDRTLGSATGLSGGGSWAGIKGRIILFLELWRVCAHTQRCPCARGYNRMNTERAPFGGRAHRRHSLSVDGWFYMIYKRMNIWKEPPP